jgi:membrane-bound inhibitor of C-type lysozyme
MRSIIACLALLGPVSSAFAVETVYRCADGTSLMAIFSAPGPTGTVRLTFAGQARHLKLPQVPSADGGRYADGATEFWIKGNAARLTRKGAATECKAHQ